MSEHKPKRNRRLLLKTAKRIESVPYSYNQETWATEDERSPCGTAACLAGELIICSERSVKAGIDKLVKLNRRDGVPKEAAQLAGLTHGEVDNLFYTYSGTWPNQFRKRYQQAKTQRGRANAAAALLRYLADGGEV